MKNDWFLVNKYVIEGELHAGDIVGLIPLTRIERVRMFIARRVPRLRRLMPKRRVRAATPSDILLGINAGDGRVITRGTLRAHEPD
jgi:hypothetical protein